MGTKKQEHSFLSNVENQEEWDKLLKFSGLFVADLYQDWNGPCKAVTSLFAKLQAEINDDRITFAHVKVDNIRPLHAYKGKCEPTFLFLGEGQLVGVVRGANAPILRQTCLLKFEEEMKVMKGEMERIVIRDPGIIRTDNIEDVLAEDTYDFIDGEMTFAILQPDIITNNLINDVMDKITEANFDIIRKEIRHINREEAMSLFYKLLNTDSADDFLSYMTGKTCCIMALMSDVHNSVIKLREIAGPADVEIAKETEPDSLRALYGSSGLRNGIHCAESREEALKSISIMFPYLVFKKNDPAIEESEKTIVAIPDRIYGEEKKSLVNQLMKADLKVVRQVEVTLTKSDLKYFYKDIILKRDLMEDRIEEINGSGLFVIILEGKNSLNIVNYMLGLYEPEEEMDYTKLTVRDAEDPDLIYASMDKATAIRDENYFFPIEPTFGIIKPDAFEQRDEILKLIIYGGFSIPLADEITLTQDQAEEIYKNIKEMHYFSAVIENLISGPSYIMILSKFDAVLEWRNFIGSINPEEAADESPDKLRGIFGSTLIQNAIHSSSSKKEAFRCINSLFGNIQIDARGNVVIQKPINSEKNFPVTVYRPVNIDDSKIQDVLKKFQVDLNMTMTTFEKEFSFKDLGKFYSSIKNPDSFLNLKCFMEIASNIIPVFLHEENDAFQKLDLINQSTQNQKNNRIRLEYWTSKFEENILTPETNYVIYKFTDPV